MAIGEIHRHRDPLPAFGRNSLGLHLQLLGDETIEQRHVLQPAAIVVLEQVAHDGAAGLLIGIEPDELDAAVGGADGILRQHPPDLVRLIELRAAHMVPHLLLSRLVGGYGKGHELFERHAIFRIDVVQLRRD